MQLKRDMLEQWYDQPFFESAVRGCVVRIVFGTFTDASGREQPNYLMMRVVEVVDKQPYRWAFGGQVGVVRLASWVGRRLNRWLVLLRGLQGKGWLACTCSRSLVVQFVAFSCTFGQRTVATAFYDPPSNRFGCSSKCLAVQQTTIHNKPPTTSTANFPTLKT